MLTPAHVSTKIQRQSDVRKLWSLWDVIKVRLDQLVAVARLFEAASSGEFDTALNLFKHTGSVGLTGIVDTFKELDLPVSADMANDILDRNFENTTIEKTLSPEQKKVHVRESNAVLAKELGTLADVLRRELKGKVSLALTEKHAIDLFENPRPFDSNSVSVNDRFPDAVYDIQEAANCRALSRPTACVFHLMRVLEVGLVALAADPDLNIPWPDRNNWQDVINTVEQKIKLLQKGAGSDRPDWHEKRQFYSDAATQFTHFKDGWRNYASHFHAVYDDAKAEIIFMSVREFMRVLATRLSSVLS
jgi:hypothetical protein